MSSNNIYYVYAYLRKDGSPYYIGKGSGQRAWSKVGRSLNLPDASNIRILAHRLSESEPEALLLETKLIATFGRKDLGTGILRNHTDGGEGISGYRHTAESKAKNAAAKLGKPQSEQHKVNKANAVRGVKYKPRTPEHSARMAAAKLGRPHPKVTCPHCGKIGGAQAMGRWHFERCKKR